MKCLLIDTYSLINLLGAYNCTHVLKPVSVSSKKLFCSLDNDFTIDYSVYFALITVLNNLWKLLYGLKVNQEEHIT